MAENEKEQIEQRWRRAVIAVCVLTVLGLAITCVVAWLFGQALARALFG